MYAASATNALTEVSESVFSTPRLVQPCSTTPGSLEQKTVPPSEYFGVAAEH